MQSRPPDLGETGPWRHREIVRAEVARRAAWLYAGDMSPRILLAAFVAIALIAWLLLVVLDVFALW